MKCNELQLLCIWDFQTFLSNSKRTEISVGKSHPKRWYVYHNDE